MDTPAVDAERLGSWFTTEVSGSVPPLTVDPIPGGRSNLTFRVTDSAGHTWVLRRPPLGAPPATANGAAHDVAREHRLLEALAPTVVPTAAPVAFCDDVSVAGASFSIIEHVDGHVLRERADAESALDEPARRRTGESFVDALVALHAVDVDRAGLGDIDTGRVGGGEVAVQLDRWYGAAQAAQEITGRGVLLIEDMYRHLSAELPQLAKLPPTLVHGDYRLDNVIVDDDGNVAAVLDWETAGLGDPLVELGLLLAYWTNPGEQNPPLGGAAPTAAAGFLTRSEVAVRYGEASGRDLSHLDFYLAFAYWKLACILEGVYAQQLARTTDRAALAPFAAQVVRLAEAAREAAA